MSRPRRRRFGPLFYSTLVVALLMGAYGAYLRIAPMIEQRLHVRALADGLRAADPQARQASAGQLLNLGPEVCIPILQEAALDPRGEVRALACRYLVDGWGDPSKSVPMLVAAAGDGREDVRIEAARGLQRVVRYGAILTGLGSSSGRSGGLTPALRDDAGRALRRLLRDPSRTIRAEAAGALGEFGPDPAIVADLNAAAGDGDRAVRLAAARALIEINGPGDPAAARTLVALAASPDAVPDRSTALQAIRTMNESVQDRAVAALAGLLSHGDPDIVPDVIACLPEAGPRARAALPALEALMNDPEPGLRAGAGMAIVAIEGLENGQPLPDGIAAGMGPSGGAGGMMGGGSGMAMSMAMMGRTSGMGMGMGMGGGAGMASPATGGPVNPRVVSILVRIVADPGVREDMRANALGIINGINPAVQAKVTPDLVRQLADPDPNVRRTAVNLLAMIIDVAPVELPEASGAR